ncbi:hypothetical protein AAKU55_005340 [Oxalobacteraceae bacterium GrIS 1.11]
MKYSLMESAMHPVMNDTKWDELRLAMYMVKPFPRWRTMDLENAYLSSWDVDWFYHFREGGYKSIQWLEIATESPAQHHEVRGLLSRIHVPGEVLPTGFRVFGYVDSAVSVSYFSAA